MAAIVIALAGAGIVTGALLPWLSLSVDFGQLASAAGGAGTASNLFAGLEIKASGAQGYEQGAGKVVLVLGVVVIVVAVLALLGYDGPWYRATVVAGGGAGAIAGFWYLQRRPSVDIDGVGFGPATGLWLVFAGAAVAVLAVVVHGFRR